MSESSKLLGESRNAYANSASDRAKLRNRVESEISGGMGRIDLDTIQLTPHSDIGVKYNRYPITVNGRTYQIEVMQPIQRKTKVYDITLMGGEDVRYLNSADLSKQSSDDVKEYIKRELEDYIKKNR